jgi:hypothetical protein
VGPNEAQLRAALHEGEGDRLDAAALISHAAEVRRARRRRVSSVIGAAAVVAVVGLGTGAIIGLGRGGSPSGSSGGRAAAESSAGADTAGAAAADRPASGPSRTAKGSAAGLPACPAAPAHYRLPGGGAATHGPLFGRPVEAVRVCGYRDGIGPTSLTLTGSDARSLATSLNASPEVPDTTVKCPAIAPIAGDVGTIEVLAVDAHGAALGPVVITINCGPSPVTNGTALRYVHLAGLPARVMKLIPVVPDHVVGSPVR